MTQQGYAGYFLKERMLSQRENVEHWSAEGAAGEAEVYLLPIHQRNVLMGIPTWNAFAEFHLVEEKHQLAVVVPGKLSRTLEAISEEESVGVSCCLAWHLAAIFGELHESGGVHGFIHPGHIGLNANGQLQIRPALSAFIPSDPDDEAAALATDCWQLSFVLQKMGILPSLDRRFGLLMSGLRQEVSRLRLQPASAIRQTLTAVIARHPEWEDEIDQRLGKQWTLDYRPVKEEIVVPHRLSQPKVVPNRPQKSRVEVDVWASPFIRTMLENNDHSSGQAMIREALRNTSNPKKFELPVMEDFQLEDEVTELEPARIQIPRNEVQLRPSKKEQPSSGNAVENTQVRRADRTLTIEPVQEILLEEESVVSTESMDSTEHAKQAAEAISGEADSVQETARAELVEEDPVSELVEPAVVLESAGSETEAVAPEVDSEIQEEREDVPDEPQQETTSLEEHSDSSTEKTAMFQVNPVAETLVSESLEEQSEPPESSLEFGEDTPLEDESPLLEMDVGATEEKTAVMEVDVRSAQPQTESEAGIPEVDSAEEMVEEQSEAAPSETVESIPVDARAEEDIAPVVSEGEQETADVSEQIEELQTLEPIQEVAEDSRSEEAESEGSLSEISPVEDEPLEDEAPSRDRSEETAQVNLIPEEEPPDELEQIDFEDDIEETVVVRSGSQTPPDFSDDSDGYVAELASINLNEGPKEVLDVQEPLANIRLPSIEEVRAEQSARIGNVDELFEAPSIRIEPQSTPQIEEEDYPEPKWADAIGVNVDEVNEDEALGDEKYAVEGSRFGDVSAAFEGSVREIDFEERGSYWGWVLILAVAFVFGIVYLMQPRMTQPSQPMETEKQAAEGMGGVAVEQVTQFSTNPPGGTIYVDRENKGVEPIMFTLSGEKNVYLICVDWGMNPICRNVPRKELEKESYTFSKEQ